MKTTVVKGVLTSYELMLASQSFLGGVFDRAATISCCSDEVTGPVTGQIIKYLFNKRNILYCL